MKLLERLVARIPAVDCCPHPDVDDDLDTEVLPATHHDYRGSATNG